MSQRFFEHVRFKCNCVWPNFVPCDICCHGGCTKLVFSLEKLISHLAAENNDSIASAASQMNQLSWTEGQFRHFKICQAYGCVHYKVRSGTSKYLCQPGKSGMMFNLITVILATAVCKSAFANIAYALKADQQYVCDKLWHLKKVLYESETAVVNLEPQYDWTIYSLPCLSVGTAVGSRGAFVNWFKHILFLNTIGLASPTCMHTFTLTITHFKYMRYQVTHSLHILWLP